MVVDHVDDSEDDPELLGMIREEMKARVKSFKEKLDPLAVVAKL